MSFLLSLLLFVWQSPVVQEADVNAVFERAVNLQRGGDLQGAAAEYRKLLSMAPKLAAAHANFGVVLAQLGHTSEAIASYETALSLDSRLKPVLLNLGILYFRSQQFAKTAETLQSFLAAAPDHLQARQLLGISLVELGRDADALPHLERAVSNAPDEVTSLYSLGLAYLHLAQPEASSIIERLKARPDSLPLARLLQGQSLIAESKFDEANAELKAVAKLNPDLPRLQYWLGVSHLMLEEKQQAQSCFERALAQSPGDAATLYQLAYVEQSRMYFDQAARHAEAALKADPQMSKARTLGGIILYKQGRAAEALQLLEAAVAKDPNDAETRHYLGRVYQRLGRKQDAAREAAESERLRIEQIDKQRAEKQKAGHKHE